MKLGAITEVYLEEEGALAKEVEKCKIHSVFNAELQALFILNS